MKKGKIYLRQMVLTFGMISAWLSLATAQSMMYVDAISYNEVEKTCLLLPPNTVLADVDPYDMPDLEYQEVEFLHEEWLDQLGNPQTSYTVLNSENSYRDWETEHKKWLFNQDGLSGFREESPNNFILNKVEAMSDVEVEGYNQLRARVQQYGQLQNIVFPQDIANILSQNGTPFQTTIQGHIYIVNQNEITVWIPGETSSVIATLSYVYNVETPTYSGEINMLDPDLESVTITTYDILFCEDQFKSSSIDIQRTTLNNGLCAKRVVETYFSNYEFDMNCRGSSRNVIADGTSEEKLSVYPNPLNSNILTIKTNGIFESEVINVKIISMDGKEVFNQQVENSNESIKLSVRGSLDSSGLYILNINDGTTSRNSKFYYINQ